MLDAMAERPISTLNKPDAALELTLRPSDFSEFIGQTQLKQRLEIAVAASKQRGQTLGHTLLNGPPGSGKTTLAYILAKSRDTGKCVQCGSRENLEYDHLIPIAKGGSNTARNIELLCESCNRSNGASIE